VNTTYAHTAGTSGRLKDQPVGERPRERLIECGAQALSPAELVAILVRTGLRGTNALDIGKQLVCKFGSLGAMARASVDDLQCIRGIGRDKAVTLVAAFTLGSKIAEELQRESPVLDNPEAVAGLLREQNRVKNVETFQILLLNTRRRLIRVEQVSQGLETSRNAERVLAIPFKLTNRAVPKCQAHQAFTASLLPRPSSPSNTTMARRPIAKSSVSQIFLPMAVSWKFSLALASWRALYSNSAPMMSRK